jgi:hypothetical protein
MSGVEDGVADARAFLEAAGFTVVRVRTYRAMQERVRIAEQMQAHEAQEAQRARDWAARAFAEQRRLSVRLDFVYGEARAAGVSMERLADQPAAEGRIEGLREAQQIIARRQGTYEAGIDLAVRLSELELELPQVGA